MASRASTTKGVLFPLDKIDDTLAEQLIGKTHVFERLARTPVTSEPDALPESTEPAGEGEASALRSKRSPAK